MKSRNVSFYRIFAFVYLCDKNCINYSKREVCVFCINFTLIRTIRNINYFYVSRTNAYKS